jgi:hypothetical protein
MVETSTQSHADLPGRAAWGQTLRVRPSLGVHWAGMAPAWAATAGALSSGFMWSASNILTLLTVTILVEALYETLGGALLWTRLSGPPSLVEDETTAWFTWLPYSAPGSPSGRLASAWARWRNRWRASYLTGPDGAFARMGVTGLLAGVLSAYLGLQAVFASVAIVLLALVRYFLGPRREAIERWIDAVTTTFIPWILAGSIFGEMSPAAIGTAVCYAVVRGALIDRGRLVTATWALLISDICQCLVAAILIVLKQPMLATILIIGLSAQSLLQLRPQTVQPVHRMARVQLLVVGGMLLAGWALGR